MKPVTCTNEICLNTQMRSSIDLRSRLNLLIASLAIKFDRNVIELFLFNFGSIKNVFFFEEAKMKYITTEKRYSRHKVYQGKTVRSEHSIKDVKYSF